MTIRLDELAPFTSVVITNVCDADIDEINDIIHGRKASCRVLDEYQHIYDNLKSNTLNDENILAEFRRLVIQHDINNLNVETESTDPVTCQICFDQVDNLITDSKGHNRIHSTCRVCYITYSSDICPSCRQQIPVQSSIAKHNRQIFNIDRALKRHSL